MTSTYMYKIVMNIEIKGSYKKISYRRQLLSNFNYFSMAALYICIPVHT